MKIIFFDSYSEGRFGAPKSMLELASGVSKRNVEVTIASSQDKGLLKKAREYGLNCFALKLSNRLLISRNDMKLLGKIMYMLNLLLLWGKLILHTPINFREADLICINDIRSFLLLLPVIIKNKQKVIWYVRINDRVKYVTSFALRASSRVILISRDCFSSFTEYELAKYSNKISVLNTGFDLNLTQASDIDFIHSKEDLVFTTVGSICKRKNQIDILKAFSSIPQENKFLYIVGEPATKYDNSYMLEVENTIKNLKIKDKVQLVGYSNKVSTYLSITDYFLFASHKEGLPRVVIEALLAGCFVVSSNVDGISDILTDKIFGLHTNRFAKDGCFLEEYIDTLLLAIGFDVSKQYISEKAKSRFSYDDFIDSFLNICVQAERQM